jgi:hypothetical protein
MPFTTVQFFDVMRQYNESVWPGQLVLYAIGVITAAVAIWKPQRSNLVLGIVALLWAWMAIAYQLMFFTRINPMAYVFAAMFLVEALLIARYAFSTRLQLSIEAGRALRLIGLSLIAYALLIYPVLGFLLGQRYPSAPTFGLPCPTTIFTLGIFAWCARPMPWTLFVVPALWSVLATSAAVSFGIGEDYALIPAVALAAVVFARKRRIPAYRVA